MAVEILQSRAAVVGNLEIKRQGEVVRIADIGQQNIIINTIKLQCVAIFSSYCSRAVYQ